MRDCKRNQRRVYYALFEGVQKLKDADGFYTGEVGKTYGTPQELRINVSPAAGAASTREFGRDVAYDRVLSISRTNLPIDEHTVFWIDNLDTTKPHDYEVVKVADGLDSTRYAVRRVNVGE